MMTIEDVLFFDTETTGVPDRSAKWDVDFMDYPHVVQMAWIFGNKAESHIIRPEGWEIPQEATDVHGITTEYAREHGEPFAAIVDLFLQDCAEAGLICGHNIHFDTGIIKANILRELGRGYYDANDVEDALYKGKRIDTMRQAMKWVDARMANGRLKFPNLGELFSRCFPGETFPAHDALEDCRAVQRCLPVLLANNLVELKIKEYPEQPTDISEPVSKAVEATAGLGTAARIASDAVKKFGESVKSNGNGHILGDNNEKDKQPIKEEKAPQIADFAKISDTDAELLDANEF